MVRSIVRPAFFAVFAAFVTLMTLSSSAQAQIIVAHRGASFDAPENTLASVRLAWEQGADGVEADFHVTADQKVVCIHDFDTKRTGGTKKVVAESTLAELRSLEYGAWKSPEFKGEPLPTFLDILSAVPPEKYFVIELKTGPEIVPLLKADLESYQKPLPKILIISFKQDTVAACRTALPNLKSHWLTGYKKNKETGVWSPDVAGVQAGLKASLADGLGTQGNREIVTDEFLETLKADGLKEFHVWTIDEPEDARYFQKLGAFGITTNKPAVIRQALFGPNTLGPNTAE